jgi:hypothetical protein
MADGRGGEFSATTTPVPMVIRGVVRGPWSAAVPSDRQPGPERSTWRSTESPPRIRRLAAYSVTNGQTGPASGRRIRTRLSPPVQDPDVAIVADGGRSVRVRSARPTDRSLCGPCGRVDADGDGPPRSRRFGNVGELRLTEASARDGGVIRGAFTVRGFEF